MFFRRSPVATVDARTAHAWLQTGEAELIDVREADETAEAAIAGAHLLPMSQVGVDAYPDFGAQKGVVICHSGVRSARIAAALAARGATGAYNLTGGIVAWIDAGLPVTLGRG
jgi:rhodanese-related sulfurtransferase